MADAIKELMCALSKEHWEWGDADHSANAEHCLVCEILAKYEQVFGPACQQYAGGYDEHDST